jgi:uncharacterized membrane protein YgcG
MSNAAPPSKRSVVLASSAALLLVGALTTDARAEVLFQNTGNKIGWGRIFIQKAGTIEEVSSPVYKGTTSVKASQTYQKSDGINYHSEIIKTMAHLAGQDLYYGQAIYLPPDWVFHSQNVTFQQWAPENPEAPWILMFLQGDKVRLGGRGANGDKDVGPITGLRGTWIRVVTRIHMATAGAFEVWINGKKFFSQNGNFRSMGPSLRWSSGIYCTRWDTETPTGPRELSIWHDNLRIATTLEEADPESWGDGDPVPGDAGASPPDAGASADGEAPQADAAPGGGGGGTATGGTGGPRPMTGGSGGGSAGVGGAGGDEPTGGMPGGSARGSGCNLGSGGGATGGGCLALAGGILLLVLRKKKRRSPLAG